MGSEIGDFGMNPVRSNRIFVRLIFDKILSVIDAYLILIGCE